MARLGARDQEEEMFKAACERFFAKNDSEAGAMLVEFEEVASGDRAKAQSKLLQDCGIVTQEEAIARRTPYLRIKDQARSEFHSAALKQREADFVAKLCDTTTHDNGEPSRRLHFERAAKALFAFGKKYSKTLGARPFLAGILTLIKKQVSPTHHVVRWTIDSAAISEASETDAFLSDAIQLLRDIPLIRINLTKTLPHSLDLELHPSWSDENLHRLLSFSTSLFSSKGLKENSALSSARPTGKFTLTTQLRTNIDADLDDPHPFSNLLCSPDMCHLS